MRARMMMASTLLALAACGGEREAEQAPQVTIDTPEGRIRVQAGGSAEANMPEGIPAYPGAERLASVGVQGGGAGQQGTVVALRTADSPAQVINFYGNAVQQARFAVQQQMIMGETAILIAERDGVGLNVTASRTDEGTHIQIVTGQSR